MLYLIKIENIFDRFYGDVYAIKYQKCGFSHIHFLIFLNLVNEFLKAFYINEVIYTKLFIIKTD